MAGAGRGAIFGRLDALSDDVRPAEWWFDNAVCEIGRVPGAHILVPRDEVSRHHARIEREATGHILLDLASSNGTYVDGRRITDRVVLADCEEIGLGTPDPVLRFRAFVANEVQPARPRFDESTRTFALGGQPLELPSDEILLLQLLWSRYQTICDRAACATAIWGPNHPASLERTALDHVVDGLRKRLRRVNPTGDPISVRVSGFILEG